MATRRAAICLTKQMHQVVEFISEQYDTSLSQLVRTSLREVSPEYFTKEDARAIGGGFFRTMVNLPFDLDDTLDDIALFSGMSRSAVIRAALKNHIVAKYAPNAKNISEVA